MVHTVVIDGLNDEIKGDIFHDFMLIKFLMQTLQSTVTFILNSISPLKYEKNTLISRIKKISITGLTAQVS